MRSIGRGAAVVAVVAGLAVLPAGDTGMIARPSLEPMSTDFDGDGHSELVVPVPNATVNGVRGAGAVAIFAGSTTGPDPRRARRIDRTTDGVPSGPAGRAWFGGATAAGDFDGDGRDDLAICDTSFAPGSAGMTLMFGGRTGLGRATVVSAESDGEGSCSDVATSDVDRDGFADLVVAQGSSVVWARGGPWARSPRGWRFETVARPPVSKLGGEDDSGPPARVGLETGDLNGDGYGDLTYEIIDGGDAQVSSAKVYLGGPNGFRSHGAVRVAAGQDAAVGDLDGDGYDDLAYGQVGFPGGPEVGTVSIWRGSPEGPDLAARPREIQQVALKVANELVVRGGFGERVAIADLDGDGRAELAVSAPHEEIDRAPDAGAVVVLPGGPGGPEPARARLYHQGNVGDRPEPGDLFGRGLWTSAGALVIGVPGENAGEGLVQVLDGPDLRRTRALSPRDAGISGKSAFGGREYRR